MQASYELLHPPIDSAADSTVRAAMEILIEPEDEGDTVRYRYVPGDEAAASTTLNQLSVGTDETPLAAGIAGETLRDLAQSLVAERPDDAQPLPGAGAPDLDDRHLQDSARFQQMLNAVLDESTALENLTLESLFDTTRELPDALGTGAVPNGCARPKSSSTSRVS